MRAAPTAPSASGHPKSAHPFGRELALRADELVLGGDEGELAGAALVGGLDQRVHAGDGALEGAVDVAAEQPVAEEEGGEGVAGAVQVDGSLGVQQTQLPSALSARMPSWSSGPKVRLVQAT